MTSMPSKKPKVRKPKPTKVPADVPKAAKAVWKSHTEDQPEAVIAKFVLDFAGVKSKAKPRPDIPW